MKTNWKLLIIACSLGVSLFLFVNSCNKQKQDTDLFNALQDTMKVTRDKLGREVAERTVLVASVSDLKKINAGKDSMLHKLQTIIDKNTSSGAVISTGTSVTGATGTTITKTDTVFKDNKIFLFPHYTTKNYPDSIATKWYWMKIEATKDSIHYNFKVFNQYSIKFENEKTGFLKPRKLTAIVTNENPNTQTIAMQSFSVPPAKKKAGLFFGVGGVAGALAAFFILK